MRVLYHCRSRKRVWMPSFSPFFYHQFQAFDQRFEFGRTQCLNNVVTVTVNAKPTALEPFSPNAIAAGFEVQALQLGAAAVDEHEAVTAQRIAAELMTHRGGQAVIGTAHVGGLCA